jgi:hypothetical protein
MKITREQRRRLHAVMQAVAAVAADAIAALFRAVQAASAALRAAVAQMRRRPAAAPRWVLG